MRKEREIEAWGEGEDWEWDYNEKVVEIKDGEIERTHINYKLGREGTETDAFIWLFECNNGGGEGKGGGRFTSFFINCYYYLIFYFGSKATSVLTGPSIATWRTLIGCYPIPNFTINPGVGERVKSYPCLLLAILLLLLLFDYRIFFHNRWHSHFLEPTLIIFIFFLLLLT